MTARIRPEFHAAYDQLMEQVQVPVVTFLDRDLSELGIGIVFQVLTDAVANLIVGSEPEREEQDQLLQMFVHELEEAVAAVREELELEENNHEPHRH
jgi:hypothetical protein